MANSFSVTQSPRCPPNLVASTLPLPGTNRGSLTWSFGADGLHSRVREQVFGPEDRFVRPLGLYFATMSLRRAAMNPDAVLMYNRPGRSLTVHPVLGTAGIGFIFRAPPHPPDNYRDPQNQKARCPQCL